MSVMEFLLFLLPVGILYIIARLCYPLELTDVDLDAYYSRVARVIWWLLVRNRQLKKYSFTY